MSQLTYTTACIAHDNVGIELTDCNDSVTLSLLKNGQRFLSITMSPKQLDLLMDEAENYLDAQSVMKQMERFWEVK